MPSQPIKLGLADGLRLLAASQLQIQAARSVALDASALGVMAVDAAVTAIVIGVRGAHGLWIAALALLALSLGAAVRALLLPGAENTGPRLADMLDARKIRDDAYLEDVLLEDLAAETLANEQGLVRKDPPIAIAVALLVLAITSELAGVLR